MRAALALLSGLWLVAVFQATSGGDVPWAVNGGVDNIRYSPLTQINRDNVSQLQVAWTYDSHDSFRASEMQSNPIVVDGVLYATTPTLKVVAVDAANGQGDLEVRSERRRDASAAIPPSRRHRYTRTASSSRIGSFLYALDKQDGPADSVVRHGRPDRSARGSRSAGAGTERQREHAGLDLRGHADPRHVGAGDAAGIARAHPRVRREHRQGALDLPHDSEARRDGLRHVAAGRLQAGRRRERVGRRDGGREDRHGLRRDRIGVVRFLRRHASRRQSLRRLRARARRAHGQVRLALSGHSSRRLGLGFSGGAESRDGAPRRPRGRRGRADHEVRLRVGARSQDRQAAVSRSRGATCRRRRSTASSSRRVSRIRRCRCRSRARA